MNIPQDISDFLQAYFEGDTSAEITEGIERWLKEDPANLRLFAEYGVIEDILFSEQQSIDSESVHTVITELNPSTAPGFTDLLQQSAFESGAETEPTNQLTGRALFAAGSYLLRQCLTPKAIATLATAAAVLLFGIVLFFVIGGQDETPDSPDIVDKTPDASGIDNDPDALTPHGATIVARIQSTMGARWIGLERGETRLQAAQPLTLSAGLAEIEMVDGARVILQAPAVFELTDGNAMRLVSGRLVAQVPPHANGFEVTTKHARVIDLGTEFGVYANSDGGLQTHVFEGSVVLSPSRSETEIKPIPLIAGEALEMDQDGVMTDLVADTLVFVRPEAYYTRLETGLFGDRITATDPSGRFVIHNRSDSAVVGPGVEFSGEFFEVDIDNNSVKFSANFGITDSRQNIGLGSLTLSDLDISPTLQIVGISNFDGGGGPMTAEMVSFTADTIHLNFMGSWQGGTTASFDLVFGVAPEPDSRLLEDADKAGTFTRVRALDEEKIDGLYAAGHP